MARRVIMPSEPGQKLPPKGRPIRQPKSGWSDSKDLAQLWRLLGNIRSDDESRLAVRYSGNGIILSPLGEEKRQRRVNPGSTIFPAQVGAKVTANGNTNEYLCDVWTSGRFLDDGTAITPAPVIDATLFILQVNGSYTVPVGTWVYALEIAGHYEAQIPIWLC